MLGRRERESDGFPVHPSWLSVSLFPPQSECWIKENERVMGEEDWAGEVYRSDSRCFFSNLSREVSVCVCMCVCVCVCVCVYVCVCVSKDVSFPIATVERCFPHCI